jgi:hypothetical protein
MDKLEFRICSLFPWRVRARSRLARVKWMGTDYLLISCIKTAGNLGRIAIPKVGGHHRANILIDRFYLAAGIGANEQ